MPFVAKRNGEKVAPPQVNDGARCVCPTCENELRVKRAHERGDSFVARHFFHYEETDCPGESDEHLRMKTIAHSKLKDEYPKAEVTLEKEVTVFEKKVGVGENSEIEVEKKKRIADVLVEFDSPKKHLGKGIAVEVQYKNKGKSSKAVERDYLRQEYSVLWLYPRDFSGRDVDIDSDEIVSFYPNVVDSKPGQLYPDCPEPSDCNLERSINLLLHEPSRLPSGVQTAVISGYLTGKGEKVLTQRKGNFPKKNGKWQNGLVRAQSSNGGWLSLTMTPDGDYLIGANKGKDKVQMKVSDSESSLLKDNAESLCEVVMDGTIEDLKKGCGPDEWENLIDGRFGNGNSKWVNPSISPSGALFLTIGKKKPETETVCLRVTEEDISDLLSFFIEVSVLLERI